MWRLYEGYGEFYLGQGVQFLAVITRRVVSKMLNDKFMLSLSTRVFVACFPSNRQFFNKIIVYQELICAETLQAQLTSLAEQQTTTMEK